MATLEVGIYLPTRRLWQGKGVRKLTAEGLEGRFTLLPRHADYVSVLVPGILILEGEGGRKLFALDEGTLVKEGSKVVVSCRNGVLGEELDTLARVVAEEFVVMDEEERKMRAVLVGLEQGMLKRFAQIRGRRG